MWVRRGVWETEWKEKIRMKNKQFAWKTNWGQLKLKKQKTSLTCIHTLHKLPSASPTRPDIANLPTSTVAVAAAVHKAIESSKHPPCQTYFIRTGLVATIGTGPACCLLSVVGGSQCWCWRRWWRLWRQCYWGTQSLIQPKKVAWLQGC